MSEIKENKMGYEPIKKLLLKMSIPLMFSMLISSVYNVVDSIFVSRISEDALTALSMSFPIQNLTIAVAVGTGVGVNSLVSRYLGMKKKDKVNSSASHAIILYILSYIIFALFGFFLVDLYFKSQTSSEIIIKYGNEYLSTICIFSFGILFQVAFEKLLQSTGKTLQSMVIQITGALLNLILDPIMIFGLFGFPEMGVKGAAIATVFGQITGGVIGLIMNIKINKEIKIGFKDFKFDFSIVKKIYEVGFPSIIMLSIGSIMVFFMNKILITFSLTAVAILGVLFKLQSFCFMPIIGLSNAMVPIIAYNYGARNKERIRSTIKIGNTSATIIIFIGVLIFQFFAKDLLILFNASDEMLKIGITALKTVSLSYLFVGVSICTVSVFQALGNGFIALFESILRQLIVLLPVSYILSLSGNLNYVWWGFFIAELASFVFVLFFLKKIDKEKIENIENKNL
ncbi:MAG: MATE family efflux transporter [Peptoniphilaceae bacterium]|nr:MATE family efflux transporter [Peptoniphilaceae bacterium]MDD7383739.1 MATE family efflux transporter [Peptoniphilaceae bacterium]MDY3737861.1 MATE family efflux transporter [Peptoniphilaceae bacterium]